MLGKCERRLWKQQEHGGYGIPEWLAGSKRVQVKGGIYDDRLLVKPTKSAIAYMTDPVYEGPYEGAKEMLLVEEVDQKEFLTGLFHAMYDELPLPKSKKKK